MVSPVDLFECFLERHERINPAINAVVLVDEKGARRAAEASDKRAREGRRLGPLDGIPLTVKDNIHVGGLRATWGSLLFADFVPTRDDLPVARLREAGAVIVGKTNTPEFAMAQVTENRIFGRTVNPWQPELTPGGSSGGAVASVAAGICSLALATDAGGSIRRPASYAGVVGFRPSTGRVPRSHGFPALAMDFQVIGPIARTVSDVRLMMDCIARPDQGDRQSLTFRPFGSHAEAAQPGRRAPATIRYVPRAGSGPIDAEIARNVRLAAETFVDLGYRLEEAVAPYDPEEIDAIWATLIGVGVGRVLLGFDGWAGKIDAGLAAIAERGRSVTTAEFLATLDRIHELRAEFAAWMSDADAMLTPSSAALPWPAEHRYPVTIDNQPASPRAAAVFSTFVNAVGHPAISLPCSPSAKGLPIGFQLVGRYGEDERLIRLALEYEQARPWKDLWPDKIE